MDTLRVATRARNAAQRAVLAAIRDSPSDELIAVLNRNLEEGTRDESVAMQNYRTYMERSSANARQG
jgi:hypothetical protein